MRIVLKIPDNHPIATFIAQRMRETDLEASTVARSMLFQLVRESSGEVTNTPRQTQRPTRTIEEATGNEELDDNAIADAILASLVSGL